MLSLISFRLLLQNEINHVLCVLICLHLLQMASRGLEKGQCHSSLQKGQEGGSRELPDGQPHLHPRKDDEAPYPGGHQQASGGKEGYQE